MLSATRDPENRRFRLSYRFELRQGKPWAANVQAIPPDNPKLVVHETRR
jgi:hypothetical protein